MRNKCGEKECDRVTNNCEVFKAFNSTNSVGKIILRLSLKIRKRAVV